MLAFFTNPRTRRALQAIAVAKGGRLPPVLYVQLDNCSRENKNWVMLSYLSTLVQLGVVAKVQLGFLPVG